MENKDIILKTIGLKEVTKNVGTAGVVKGLVKDTVGEEVPLGSELLDKYYPDLYQKLIAQEVINIAKSFALEDGVFTKESWPNGIKEYLTVGLLQLFDYGKDITLDDFNPADPNFHDIKFNAPITKYDSVRRTKPQILRAFTNGDTIEAFANQILGELSLTWRNYLQNERNRILVADENATLNIVFDEIVVLEDMETLDRIELFAHYMESFQTNSPDWLALTDETFTWSAPKSDIGVIARPYAKAAIGRASATLYNYDQIVADKLKNAPSIDSDRAGTPNTGIYLWIHDNKAYREGYQIENMSWSYNEPKLQTVYELHNWLGFAYIPTLYKSVWVETQADADRILATYSKNKKVNKVFKTVITKGKEKLINLRKGK